jgi:hypothetical protein
LWCLVKEQNQGYGEPDGKRRKWEMVTQVALLNAFSSAAVPCQRDTMELFFHNQGATNVRSNQCAARTSCGTF